MPRGGEQVLLLLLASLAPASASHQREAEGQEEACNEPSALLQRSVSRRAFAGREAGDSSSRAIKVIFKEECYGIKDKECSANETYVLQQCPSLCVVSHDRKVLADADAVVWNARFPDEPREGESFLWSKKPGDENKLAWPPSQKPAGQKWVFNFFMEAPVYNGQRIMRDEVRALSDRMDWTMTYRPGSDFYQPQNSFIALDPEAKAMLAGSPPRDYSRGRDRILLWFVKNPIASRLEFARNLSALLPPGSFHMYGLPESPSPCQGRNESDACHQALFSKYKFYAAFENSRCDGYITEKFFRGVRNGMVPLVMGGSGASDYERLGAPRSSFVDVDDFPSMEALAMFLQQVDHETYSAYFAWEQEFALAGEDRAQNEPWCQLCQELHKPPTEQRRSRSFGDSLADWWYGSCRKPTPSYFNQTGYSPDDVV